MKRIAIVQSNYIPWKGYFDLIGAVDEFVLYDDVQYTNNDWRNRNLIKTPQGLQWLTVPIRQTGRFQQLIRETEIAGEHWKKTHWKSLQLNYQRAPFFSQFETDLSKLYLMTRYTHISALNLAFLTWCAQQLTITTRITSSSDYVMHGSKTERLVNICLQSGATEYISGPAAKSYLDESLFNHHNIKVTWFDYGKYPDYPQLWGTFAHGVSILDLLFNTGEKAKYYLHCSAM